MPKRKRTTEIPISHNMEENHKHQRYDIQDHFHEQHNGDSSSKSSFEITEAKKPKIQTFRQKCFSSVGRKKDKERKQLQRMQATQSDSGVRLKKDANTNASCASSYGAGTISVYGNIMNEGCTLNDEIILVKLHRKQKVHQIKNTVFNERKCHLNSTITERNKLGYWSNKNITRNTMSVFRNECKQFHRGHNYRKRQSAVQKYRRVTKHRRLKKIPSSLRYKTCLHHRFRVAYISSKTLAGSFEDRQEEQNAAMKKYKDHLPDTQNVLESCESKCTNSGAFRQQEAIPCDTGIDQYSKHGQCTCTIQNCHHFQQHDTENLCDETNLQAFSNNNNLESLQSIGAVTPSHELAFKTQNFSCTFSASEGHHIDKHAYDFSGSCFNTNTDKDNTHKVLSLHTNGSDQNDIKQVVQVKRNKKKKRTRRKSGHKCFSSAARKKDRERKRRQRLHASHPDSGIEEEIDTNTKAYTVSVCGGMDIISDHGNRQINDEHIVMQLHIQKEMYKEQRRLRNKKKYHFDIPFRERKKLMSRNRYWTDADAAERKKFILTQKYKQNYKGYRDRRQKYDLERYKTVSKYRQLKKTKSSLKYKTSLHHRNRVKYISTQKYRENPPHRQKVKDASIQKYRENPQHRQEVKDASIQKYRENPQHRQGVKDASIDKYRENPQHRQGVKDASIDKYRENPQHRHKVKDASIDKYRENPQHRHKVKDASIDKYRENPQHRHKVMESSKWKYSHDIPFREHVKTGLRSAYKKNSAIKKRKVQMNRKRRKQQQKAMTNLALFFRQQVQDGPKYTCCACHKFKFRKQVVICDVDKYKKKGCKAEVMAQRCITCHYSTKCVDHCLRNCKNVNHNNLWICFTCHRHILKGEMPADAVANNLELKPIPAELQNLNPLERQLLSLRIPFMKLVSLPKGGQKGVVGPCVSIPTDVQRTTKLLPRCERDSELVRVKLKRKLTYKGHYQYQYICPTKVKKGLQYLQENNQWYSDTELDQTWVSPIVEPDATDQVTTGDTEQHETTLNETKNSLEIQDMEEEDDEITKNKGLPFDTCLQPADIGQEMLDQYFDGIFCIAPGEEKTPVSMLTEKGNEAMSFPVQFPDGQSTYDNERAIRLTRSRYFHARLLNADSRFSTDSQYIFYAQYLSELEQVVSQVSIALRKGTSNDHSGIPITADMMKDPNTVKNILKTDQGYKFLTPIRGTPPYWQSTLKDLFAMIRQLGIPTWFCTFSAADMRWTEVMEILLEQQGIEQSPDELDWLQKCEVLRNSAIMNAVTFDHRFHTLLKQIIIDRGVIGKVKDHFHRIEFQQRGSPHTHCLFWIDNAPLLDRDDDGAVCSFVDEYISCALPSEEDSELHEIVNSVQKHSSGHSKACKKKGNQCRFNFPRPPSVRTFVSRQQSLTDPSSDAPPEQMITQAKEILQTLWTVINNIDLQQITTENLFSAAGITQEQFEDASNILTKRTNIVLQRSPRDVWINQYNPTLLRSWNANMDIQYITDAYSCVMYIISYISKAEREMGLVLEEARKEAAEGSLDAQQAMKTIGGAYFHHREVSAQEAAYRVCGLHLKESSRKVQFIPVGKDPVKMSKPLSLIQKQSNEMDDADIWMPTVLDRYRARPLGKQFDTICLATFCSQYRVLSSSQVPKDTSKPQQVHQLQNNLGFIQKRVRSDAAVVRYPRFSSKTDSELYYKSLLQLFLPHRSEEQLKPVPFQTFEDFYTAGAVKLTPSSLLASVATIVDANKQKFEVNADALDAAEELLQKVGPLEDAWALICPESESNRLECNMEREQYPAAIETQNIQIPELEQHQNHPNIETLVEMSGHIISTNEAMPLLQSMNIKQKQIFYNVRQWCMDKVNGKHPEPFHLFVTGGAGTGKSHLIKCLYYEARKILAPSSSNPDDTVVLLTAPTGTAAFNIGGTTLHQAFQLPQYMTFPYQHMRDEKLNTLRCKLQNLAILIIDEISMVGQQVFTYVNERLRQIKQTGNAVFGNVSIIAVGDFYQLPPVKQTPLYDLRPKQYFPLWSLNFSVVQLDEIMRQRDDSPFADLLNRLRIRKKGEPLDKADITCLQACQDKQYDNDVLHIFATNDEVEKHNTLMIDKVCGEYQTFIAQDFDKDVITNKLSKRETPYPTTSDHLPPQLLLAKGARVMLIRNVDVSDGLVNGVVGTVSNIIPPATDSHLSGAIHVIFDNPKVGLKQRQSTPSHLEISQERATIIKRMEETLKKNAVRYQFPFRLAWGCTVHKVQGITTENLVVSFQNIFAPGMAYVALSRVTSLKGLVIKDFNADKIYCTNQISEAIKRMPHFLPETVAPMLLPNTIHIMLHNIQGLIPHIHDLRSNTDIAHSNYICLTETWLKQDSTLPSLQHFQFRHKPRFNSYNSSLPISETLMHMKHGGVGIFCRKNTYLQEVSTPLCNIETMAFHIPEIHATVVLIYRPEIYTTSAFLPHLEKLLLHLPQTQSTLVIGDFNQDLLKKTSTIKDFMTKLGFQQFVNTSTTDSGTLLDHVYMKGTLNVQTDIVNTYYSYHNMVSIQLAIG